MTPLILAATVAPNLTTAYFNGVIAIIVAIIGGAFTAFAVMYPHQRRIRRADVAERQRSRQTQDAILEHVGNSHTTNLRDDIDGVTARLDRISGDIGDVKKAQAANRTSLTKLAARLTEHIDGR